MPHEKQTSPVHQVTDRFRIMDAKKVKNISTGSFALCINGTEYKAGKYSTEIQRIEALLVSSWSNLVKRKRPLDLIR